jgi:hypothetical protein
VGLFVTHDLVIILSKKSKILDMFTLKNSGMDYWPVFLQKIPVSALWYNELMLKRYNPAISIILGKCAVPARH